MPEFLDKSPITCQNSECQYFKDSLHPMTVKGWNDNCIARRVIGLDQNYFVITKRIQCRKIPNSETSGCGKSMNYYVKYLKAEEKVMKCRAISHFQILIINQLMLVSIYLGGTLIAFIWIIWSTFAHLWTSVSQH